MAKRAGGRESLRIVLIDYKNYLQMKRTIQMRLGDISGVLEYIQGKVYKLTAIQVGMRSYLLLC